MMKPDILTEVRWCTEFCALYLGCDLCPLPLAVCVADLLDGQRFSDIGVS